MVTYKHNFSPTHAIVKLVNGDELITTITEKTDNGITITKPCQVLRVMMPTGQAMIQCANYLIFNNKNPQITINWRQIIFVTEDVDSEVIQHYNSFVKNLENQSWSHEHTGFLDDEEEFWARAQSKKEINDRMREYWKREISEKVDKRMQMNLLANMDSSNSTIH